MRVIAGALGGRRLVAPRGLATRPTSDRVREALFSRLGDVSGAAVLDVFAGTGALGIESISRGATRATFVENARPALVALRENLAALGLASCTTILAEPATRAVASLARASTRFDLVFVDPPYADLAAAAAILARLVAQSSLANDARAVLEHASRDAAPTIEGLASASTRSYGDTSVTIYDIHG